MNIYESIIGVMSELGAIGKDRRNQQQGFAYRGIDDVMNNIQPLLCKHKIFIVPEVLEQTREERTNSKGTTLLYSILKVRFNFIADDGSSVSAVTIGEGMDSGDKASNKAMSVAFKYACFQVFCIPTEEMVDPDAESYQVAPQADVITLAKKRAEVMKLANDKGVSIKAIEENCKKPIDEMSMEELESVVRRLNISKGKANGDKSES